MVQVAGPPSPPPPGSSRDRLLGTLVCIVLRAKNLPNKARIGKQNPYCTIQYGLHKKRTATIERGGQQPEWDAEFRFEVLRDDHLGSGRDDNDGDLGPVAAHGTNAVVTRDGGVLPSSASSTSTSTLAKLDKARPVVPPLATGYPPNRRVLRIACWADDARDPKLIGEGELDFEATVKSGKFDDWVQLSRKGRYAGEVYLELTWYSNEPRPAQSPRKASLAAASAYGGAGSRVEGPSGSDDGAGDDDDARTEEWDGGSQVGLSAAMGARATSQGSFRSASGPPAELSADYPDADLAPLTSSFSTLSMATSVSHRPPLPQPPAPRHAAASPYPQHHPHPHSHPHAAYDLYAAYRPEPSTSSAPYGVAPTPNPYGYDPSGSPAASSFAPSPGAPYSHPHSHPHAYPYPQQAPTPAQGPYGAYPPPPSLGEFGQYAGAQQQAPRTMGEFEQLAHEHYAGQGYPHASASTSSAPAHYASPLPPPPPPPPQPPTSAAPPFHSYTPSLPPAPVPPTPQPPYPYPAPHGPPHPPAHSHSLPPPAAPYQLPQPPVPPIPPSSSPYWNQPYPPQQQQQQQQQQHALPHASSYPSLSHHPHAHPHAQYFSPTPSSAPPFPQPQPPGSFAPPPPPSLAGTFSPPPPPPPSLRGQADHPSAVPPQPPVPPQHAACGAYGAPPPPPSSSSSSSVGGLSGAARPPLPLPPAPPVHPSAAAGAGGARPLPGQFAAGPR